MIAYYSCDSHVVAIPVILSEAKNLSSERR